MALEIKIQDVYRTLNEQGFGKDSTIYYSKDSDRWNHKEQFEVYERIIDGKTDYFVVEWQMFDPNREIDKMDVERGKKKDGKRLAGVCYINDKNVKDYMPNKGKFSDLSLLEESVARKFLQKLFVEVPYSGPLSYIQYKLEELTSNFKDKNIKGFFKSLVTLPSPLHYFRDHDAYQMYTINFRDTISIWQNVNTENYNGTISGEDREKEALNSALDFINSELEKTIVENQGIIAPEPIELYDSSQVSMNIKQKNS